MSRILIGILSHDNILFWRPEPQFPSLQVTDSEAGIIGKGNNIPQDIRYRERFADSDKLLCHCILSVLLVGAKGISKQIQYNAYTRYLEKKSNFL